MKLFLGTLLVAACALLPTLSAAQDGGARRASAPATGDTSATGAHRAQLEFAELVFAKRAEIQLGDSQLVKLRDIRIIAATRRAMLTREADSVRAAMVITPYDESAPIADSSRRVAMSQRRALGALLGDLHDVDVNARLQTLAMLNPLQRKKAELLQEIADSPPDPKAEGGRLGKQGRAAASRRPRGGSGVP